MQASPADGHEAAKTGNDARQSIRWIPAFAGSWKRNPLPDPEGAPASPAAPKPGSGRAPVFENDGSRTARAGRGRRKDVASALEAFLGVSTPWFGLMEGSEIPEEKTAEPSTVRDPTSNSTNHRRRNTPSKCIPA